jgi:hypothetical protein
MSITQSQEVRRVVEPKNNNRKAEESQQEKGEGGNPEAEGINKMP